MVGLSLWTMLEVYKYDGGKEQSLGGDWNTQRQHCGRNCGMQSHGQSAFYTDLGNVNGLRTTAF